MQMQNNSAFKQKSKLICYNLWLLKRINLLVYIHIPFCHSKCPYCSFGSLTGQNDKFKEYFKALKLDLEQHLNDLKPSKIKSVFIGGGTPSVVKAELYEPIFSTLAPFIDKDTEITSEANPNSSSQSWLNDLKALGLNRISFGAQSFYEDKLKMLGRNHSAKDVFKAVSAAKKAGFTNINVDMIYGTALDDKERLKGELGAIKSLEISHASAYSLSIEKGTAFFKQPSLAKDDEVLARFVIDGLNGIGLKQYEISNFGKICQHNLGYWQGREYLGVGAFSVGFMKNKRSYASKNLSAYLAQPLKREYEILSEQDLKTEKIFLGFRSVVGVDTSWLSQKELQRLKILQNEGLVYLKGKQAFAKEFLLADELALYLMG